MRIIEVDRIITGDGSTVIEQGAVDRKSVGRERVS